MVLHGFWCSFMSQICILDRIAHINKSICRMCVTYLFVYLFTRYSMCWKLSGLHPPSGETPITASGVLFLKRLNGCSWSLLLLTFLPLYRLWYFPLPCLPSPPTATFSASSQREMMSRGGSSEPESRGTRGDQEQITGSHRSSSLSSQARCFPIIRGDGCSHRAGVRDGSCVGNPRSACTATRCVFQLMLKKTWAQGLSFFYFPLCLTPARRVLTSHVYKGKKTTEIQMATCGMLQSYQALLLYGKYRKDDRLKEADKWKVANSGAGKEKET